MVIDSFVPSILTPELPETTILSQIKVVQPTARVIKKIISGENAGLESPIVTVAHFESRLSALP